MTMQDDDMEALDRYMKTTPIRTQLATTLRDNWIVWYDGLGWYEKSFNPGIFDEARNRKNAFNLANTTSAAEREGVKEQQKYAFTSEEATGEARRVLADGTYNVRADPLSLSGKEDFFPLRVKIAAGIGAAALVTLVALKKIYIDPFTRR